MKINKYTNYLAIVMFMVTLTLGAYAKDISLTEKALAAKDLLGLKYTFNTEGNVQNLDWEIILDFDKPVSEESIYKHIQLIENGKKQKIKILNCKYPGYIVSYKLNEKRNRFFIASAKKSVDKAKCQIKIDNKLTSVDKKFSLAKNINLKFTTSSSIWVVKNHYYFNSKSDKGLKIVLSDEISNILLRRNITVFPPIGYFDVRKEYGKRNYTYTVKGNFQTGKTYKLDISKVTTNDKRVLSARTINFTQLGPKPRIRFDVDRSVLELKSKQLIPLSFTNVANFKCDFIKVPPIFVDDFDELTAFAKYEEKRPLSTTDRRLNDDRNKLINKFAEGLDKLVIEKKNLLHKIRSLFIGDSFKDFLPFVKSTFTSESEAFIGSDDRDIDYYFSLPLDSRPEPTKGGPLAVRINEIKNKDGQKTARLFQITDLSITYKFSANGLLIWITSIEKGVPVADVSVILGVDNDKKLLAGKTNTEGLLILEQGQAFSALQIKSGEPELHSESLNIHQLKTVLVATENDSAYIRLNTNRFAPAYVKQAIPGMSRKITDKAKLFTERGVYRQGETVFWKAIIRGYKDNGILPTAGQKIRAEIVDPRDNIVFDEELLLNEYGTCSSSFKLKDYSKLGRYQITLTKQVLVNGSDNNNISDWNFLLNKSTKKASAKNANNTSKAKKPTTETRTVTIVQTGFEVQQFEPPRHFVSFEMKSKVRIVDEIVGRKAEQKYLECKVKGLYYTGGPLKHSKIQWTAYLVGQNQNEANYSQYHFGNNDTVKQLIESGNSLLDKNGELILAFPLSDSVLGGMNSIEISATVLDVDGKAATGIDTYKPNPEIKVGITKLPDSLVQGQEFPLQIIALAKNSELENAGEILVNIMKKRWFYTQKRDAEGGIYYSWESGWVRTQSVKQNLSNTGIAKFDLVLADSGDYLIQAAYEKNGSKYEAAYSFTVGYAYESFVDHDGRRRTRSENEMVLMPDKNLAATKDTVKFHYSLPRPAKYALITKESDKLVSARVIRVNSRQGSFSEVMTDECLPNIYVSITAPGIRNSFPVYNSQIDSDYPRPFFAVTNIKVQNKVDKLKIHIAPSEKTELTAHPGDEYRLKVNVKDASGSPAKCELALCVVDEAILSLTGFKTPDLSNLVDFVLPLSVYSGDLRTSLISQELYKLISTRSLTGGGMGGGDVAADMKIRKDFRPVAFWNAALITDQMGNVEVSFKLPDSTTSYRVYAVAIDTKAAFDSASRQLKVTKEFYIEPGLPRFLTLGDKASFPLSLCNKTGQSGKAQLTFAEGKNLTIKPENKDADMTPFTNSIIKTAMKADSGVGEAKLVFAGNFNGYKDAIERELPVLTSNPVITVSKLGHLTGDAKIEVEYPKNLEEAMESDLSGALEARLMLTTSSWNKIAPSLRYLMRYPYGCLEQTSSAIIPLIAIRNLIKLDKLPGFNIEEVDEYINSGIARVLKMQTYDGGFGYWMGDRKASWWGTQYAVLALNLAKKAGIDVDDKSFNSALSYIRTNLFKRKNDNIYKHGVMALSLVNLAMNKKLSIKELKAIGAERFPLSENETLPLLLWTDALIGSSSKKARDKALKHMNADKTDTNNGWYSSSAKSNALCLIAYLACDANKKEIDNFAGELLFSVKPDGRWNSTADTGIALYALAKYFEKYDTGKTKNVDVEVKIGDVVKKVNTGKHGVSLTLDAKEMLKAKSIAIKAADNDMINWTLTYSYPDLNSTTNTISKGFDVTKRIENLNGKKVIRVGDLVKVTLEFENSLKNNRSVLYHYLAMEDAVPAGLLPVNPALKNENVQHNQSENEEDAWYGNWEDGCYTISPDHFEIHNDKVMVFKNRFWSNRYRYTYFARAICEGSFKMKPTRVSLMYNPDVFGQTKSEIVHILPMKK